MTYPAVAAKAVQTACDVRPLGWARAAIGALLLLRTTPILYRVHSQLFDTWPLLGWPEPGWHALSNVLPLPNGLIQALCVLRTMAALFFMLGVWTTASGLCAGLCGYLVLIQDPFGFIFTLHLLYQAAILLALTDAGAAFALRATSVITPNSSYLLIHAFVASIYLWAGLYKLRPDWLDGRTLGLFYQSGVIHGRLADWMLATSSSRAFVASAVAALELALGPLLLWRKSRRYALVAAFGFHATLEMTAHPDLLGWGMAALLLGFVRPESSSRMS